MKRTNIYLSDGQLGALKAVAAERDVPVAVLVREAVDSWLDSQGVRLLGEDEWQRRFEELLERRRRTADELGVSAEAVDADVLAEVKEVRRARAARRP
jgi:hypothetical protein